MTTVGQVLSLNNVRWSVTRNGARIQSSEGKLAKSVLAELLACEDFVSMRSDSGILIETSKRPLHPSNIDNLPDFFTFWGLKAVAVFGGKFVQTSAIVEISDNDEEDDDDDLDDLDDEKADQKPFAKSDQTQMIYICIDGNIKSLGIAYLGNLNYVCSVACIDGKLAIEVPMPGAKTKLGQLVNFLGVQQLSQSL